ncbi:MAG: hypothetical protein HC859_07625 [Bacteroidia bacterium]|nr:hypothetical protein [Bacteroidia bacterium]
MKTTWNAFLILTLLTVAVSCKDDDESAPLSNEEAAEMIAASLSESSSGLTVMVNESAETTTTAVDASDGGRINACGYTDTESFSSSSPQGSLVTYNYTYSYSYVLACGLDVPQSMAVDITYSGNFDAPRLASEHAGTVDLAVTELDAAAASYLINGDYSTTGSFQSKIRNKTSTTSTIDITVADLSVNKSTYTIEGGTAAALITATATGKGTFTFTASIVFEGDGGATVTVNGTTYSVNLTTGDVSEI